MRRRGRQNIHLRIASKLMQSKSLLRVDLHTHTWYSGDSITSPAALVRRARAAGLDRVAVTDHGAIAGAFAARAIDPDLIIVGEEIRCSCGADLIGLFLKEMIPVGQSLERTASLIRGQGGVVYAPHPYAYLTWPRRRAARVLAVADVVEIHNSRAFYRPWNRRASERAKALDLPGAVGTDAHMPWEIGRAYAELPPFTDARSFLAAVANAQSGSVLTGSAWLHILTLAVQGGRLLMGRGHGVPLRQPPLRRGWK